jgi:exodeoxyribonuclease V alpha subunit
MAKLVRALPSAARLVLLGDKDQLASVEAGAVLGDICGEVPGFSAALRARLAALGAPADDAGAAPPSPARGAALADSVVLLRRSYRFAGEGGIGALAQAVRANDAARALAILRAGGGELAWREPPGDPRRLIGERVEAGLRPYLERVRAGAAPEELFAAYARFRALCARRTGPYGVAALNEAVRERLAARGHAPSAQATAQGWYAGRPVMITRNDYAQKLYNGDIGIALPDPQEPARMRVAFEAEGPRLIAPARLPEHETVYAMTVHKSQGSEADEVLLVLPDAPSPLLTRELLYTAITRARRHVEIWASEAVLQSAIAQPVRRASGLREALWGEGR